LYNKPADYSTFGGTSHQGPVEEEEEEGEDMYRKNVSNSSDTVRSRYREHRFSPDVAI
jgi:hypothetical protein